MSEEKKPNGQEISLDLLLQMIGKRDVEVLSLQIKNAELREENESLKQQLAEAQSPVGKAAKKEETCQQPSSK